MDEKEEDGVTWGDDDSIGKQMLRKALKEYHRKHSKDNGRHTYTSTVRPGDEE